MAKRKAKSVKKHYIVTWDNDDGDPVQVFSSLDEAKKFAAALVTKDSDTVNDMSVSSIDTDYVQTDTVKVYEGILLGQAKATVTFEL
jgi:hypothetical protein